MLEEYVEAVRAAQARTAQLARQLHEAAQGWSLGAAAQAAMALRGLDRTAAITLLAELRLAGAETPLWALPPPASTRLEHTQTVAAIAPELCGFVWAVVCEVQRPGTFSAPA